MGWSLLPNALRPFWNLLCFPNLDPRTWICRLNFAQRPIFSGLRFFNEPEISDVVPSLKSWKNPSTSARFELANLESRDEHSTLRPPRPTEHVFTKRSPSCWFFLRWMKFVTPIAQNKCIDFLKKFMYVKMFTFCTSIKIWNLVWKAKCLVYSINSKLL